MSKDIECKEEYINENFNFACEFMEKYGKKQIPWFNLYIPESQENIWICIMARSPLPYTPDGGNISFMYPPEDFKKYVYGTYQNCINRIYEFLEKKSTI